MKCGYCQFTNLDEEHRCRRCGRRLQGTAQAAPPHLAEEHVRVAVRALGANALAARTVTAPVAEQRIPAQKPPARPISLDAAPTLDELPKRNLQPSLFGAELQPKIIPFGTITRVPPPPGISAGGGAAAAPALARPALREPDVKAEKPRSTSKPATKKQDTQETQTTLDFLPPAKPAARTLKTNAEAVIYCDAAVAAPIHRATAAALDASMILIAFGIMLGTFLAMAHPAPLSRTALLMTGGLLAISALLYGLVFAIAGTVTPGLRWTNLRLINFDGFAPDWRSRALRLTGCWIGVLSGGLGLFWALVDEENLTWHDHISKTFPTVRESDSVIVLHRG
jgi:uncharacterized RDD family membrane protein YckC